MDLQKNSLAPILGYFFVGKKSKLASEGSFCRLVSVGTQRFVAQV